MCPDPDSAHPERDMRMIEAFKQISARACEMAPRVGLQKNEVLLCDNFRVTLAKALRHRVGVNNELLGALADDAWGDLMGTGLRAR